MYGRVMGQCANPTHVEETAQTLSHVLCVTVPGERIHLLAQMENILCTPYVGLIITILTQPFAIGRLQTLAILFAGEVEGFLLGSAGVYKI